MVTVLQNLRLVTDGAVADGLQVLTEGGRITAVQPLGTPLPAGARVIDLGGDYLSAGWIDLHCHGGDGAEFIDGTPDAVAKAAAIHAAHGTRVLYPTVSAADMPTVRRALAAVRQALPALPLVVPGVHLEGPYLAPEMCGAQDTGCITAPVKADYTALLAEHGDLIARWTYAPERDDGGFLAALTAAGVVPSMGHSAAEYSHVLAAFEGGCRLVTHLYSCTSTITRHGGFRRLGIIETAYLLRDMFVEAIGDGCHLPPELLRLIVQGKGADRVCLVTDAIRYAGPNAAAHTQGGTASVPWIIEDGVAKLADRSAFAGSIATTDVLLQRTVAAGVPLADAVRMLTQTPAAAVGLAGYGRVAPGCAACFTRFDAQLAVRELEI